MKTKLLALLLLVAIFTTMLCSCEIIKLANNILKFIPGNDSDNGDTNININIGGTTGHVHTETIIPAIESTCTEHGKTEGKKCSTCGEVTVPQEAAPLKEHTYDNAIDRICNVCEHVRDIDCSHNGATEFLPAKESTCTETGLTQGVKCTICGETIVAQQALPLKDHVSSDWIIDYEATTEKEGLRHIECTICGTVTQQESIPMIIPSSEGLEYKLNKDGNSYYVKSKGTCTSQAIVIASVYEGKPVTAIGSSAFYGCSDLISITIPDSITRIESSAFYNCTSLQTIKLGKSVTYFGDSAFLLANNIKDIYYSGDIASWCSIEFVSELSSPFHLNCSPNLYINGEIVTRVDIPNSVTQINQYTFSFWTFLTDINIPDSVTEIASYAFLCCTSLENVVLPKSIESIRGGAFSNCTSLVNINIPSSITNYASAFEKCESLNYNEFDNAYYLGDDDNPYLILMKAKNTEIETCQINENTRFIGDNAFKECSYMTSIILPDSLTSIGGAAFLASGLESIVIPNSVVSIGSGAFRRSSLTNITLPSSLTVIEYGLFESCRKLKSIVIPDSVTSIGDNAFYNCSSLESVVMGNSVKTIGRSAFENCGSLKSINLSQSLTKINNNTFAYCHSLERIVIPKSVTEIYSYAFICSEKLNIYCESKYQPSTWQPYWDYADWQGTKIPVVWGYTGE